MAGIIKDGDAPKVLWEGLQEWFEAAYDPEKMAAIQARLNKPLTRKQKLKLWWCDKKWRVSVAWSVLRHGEDSPEIHNQY